MAYRDEHTCHLCGQETHRVCPSCGNGVCAQHTLQSWFPEEQKLSASKRATVQRLAKRLGGPDACSQCVEKEIEISERAASVTVLRTGDPIHAQMITEMLLSEGLDARLLGTQNAALLGAGQCIFEQRIEVLETQAERALELIEALGSGRGLEQDETDEQDEDSDEPGAGANRSRKVAVGLVVMIALAVGLLIAAMKT